MKKARVFLLSVIFMMLCCLLPAGEAQAATARKLFSVVVNDGFASQTIPVYQYTESGGNTYVAAGKSYRTLQVYAGSKSASVSVTAKKSLYKKNFKSVSYKKSVSLGSSTVLNFTLKQTNGTKKKFSVTLKRPAMPKISSLTVSPGGSTGFTPGNFSRMAVKVKVKSSVPVKAYYRIKNSKGKTVYTKVLGTKTSVNYTAYWSGKPSKGNAAGLSSSAYVPAGTYKLTAYLQYTVGNKYKTISKTVNFTVREETDSSQAETSSFQAKDWNWNVILTGDQDLDYLAELICQETLNNNMSEITRAKTLFAWVAKNHGYYSYATHGRIIPWNSTEAAYPSYMDITSSTAKSNIASYKKYCTSLVKNGKARIQLADNYFADSTLVGEWGRTGLIKRMGSCAMQALVYRILCRHAGIETEVLWSNNSHFWNAVKIGNIYYYADVNYAQSGYSSKKVVSYGYFLIGKKDSRVYNAATGKSKAFFDVVSNSRNNALLAKVSDTSCPGK